VHNRAFREECWKAVVPLGMGLSGSSEFAPGSDEVPECEPCVGTHESFSILAPSPRSGSAGSRTLRLRRVMAFNLINAGQRGNEMDDDQEILDLLAREIRDPDLRRRIFALLERDPATLTPQEQELVEHTVGGILSAETERLRAATGRLRGPWWLPRLFRKPRRPPDPGAAPPSRGPPEMPTAATDDDRCDDISVRGYLRHLRWIAPALLVGCLGMWALGARGMSLPWALFLWVLLTVAVGPLIWLRLDVRRGARGWWRALGLAVLWSLGVIALLGIGYALVMAVLSGN
jgi:hypothetical protein